MRLLSLRSAAPVALLLVGVAACAPAMRARPIPVPRTSRLQFAVTRIEAGTIRIHRDGQEVLSVSPETPEASRVSSGPVASSGVIEIDFSGAATSRDFEANVKVTVFSANNVEQASFAYLLSPEVPGVSIVLQAEGDCAQPGQ